MMERRESRAVTMWTRCLYWLLGPCGGCWCCWSTAACLDHTQGLERDDSSSQSRPRAQSQPASGVTRA